MWKQLTTPLILSATMRRALAVVPKYMDLTPEKAARLGVYRFYKSTEAVDFAAVKRSADTDVQEFLYQSLAVRRALPRKPPAKRLPRMTVNGEADPQRNRMLGLL